MHICIYIDEWMAIKSTCTHRYARHLSGHTYVSIPLCTTCPYRHTCVRAYIYEHNRQIYSDIDIVIYIYIYMHTDAHLSIPSHLYPYRYIHTHVHTRGYGCRQTPMGPPMMCVCVGAYPGIHACLDVQASIHAHVAQMGVSHPRAHTRMRTCAPSHGIYARTHTHTCTHTYEDVCAL
jgi:hypothetical protein